MFASRFHFAEFSISGEALVNQLVVDVVLTPHHRRQLQKLCLILFMKWRTISGKSRSLSRAIGGKLKNEQQSNVIKLNISLHQLILLQSMHTQAGHAPRPPAQASGVAPTSENKNYCYSRTSSMGELWTTYVCAVHRWNRRGARCPSVRSINKW